jgi:MoaA/NifB/PqqE/SkfB family radical SAM enzyme
MSTKITTIDFHVTSECNQECPYCWGPMDFEHPVSTATAKQIIAKIKKVGAQRIVFTGGDPLKRPDIGELIIHAKKVDLEVALSTTGDELTEKFLFKYSNYIDLISLPLDGSTEAINSQTKKEGHYQAILNAMEMLKKHPNIDVKVCTPVTKHNINDVPSIIKLVSKYSNTTKARVFYNVFQAFPRSLDPPDWKDLIVTDKEFSALKQKIGEEEKITVNFLDHETLDRLYVMIFPDGSLVIPKGSDFYTYGKFLEIEDFKEVLESSNFDLPKHIQHSQKWKKVYPVKGSNDLKDLTNP